MRVAFLGLLTLLFIGLKLANVIAWSWFWVLSPILFAIALAIVFGIFLVILELVVPGSYEVTRTHRDPYGYRRFK